jgi:Fic family protein
MVRASNNIEQWIKFFLVGVAETAQKSRKTFERIIELRQKIEAELLSFGRRAKAGRQLLNSLYSQPIVTVKIVEKELKITHPAANMLIRDFQKAGILKEMTGFKRNRLFAFSEYLALFGK